MPDINDSISTLNTNIVIPHKKSTCKKVLFSLILCKTVLNIKQEFTIIKEYNTGELPLYHMDVYRLEDATEDIGIEEYFDKDGVTIIE